MNKTKFIEKLSRKTDISFKICKKFLDDIYFLICDNLKKGQEINFYGFGKFYVKTCSEKLVKDNFKRIQYLVPPKSTPVFKVSKVFKKIIK